MPDMMAWFVGLLAASTVAAGGYLVLQSWQRRRPQRHAAYEVARGLAPAAGAAPVLARPKRTLADRLAGTGVRLGPQPVLAYRLIQVVLAGLGAGLLLVLDLPLILVLGGAAAGWLLPGLWLGNQESARRKAMDLALPQALGLIISALRVQPALAEALAMAATTLQESGEVHLSSEFMNTASQMRAPGMRETALLELAARSPSASLRYVVQLLLIYLRVGGEFITVLSDKAAGVRESLSVRQEAQARAADTKLTMLVIPGLLVVVTLFLFQDPQFAVVYRDPLGQVVLGIAAASIVLGNKIVNGMLDEI